MAEVKFLKESEEWLLFKEYYELCQKYWKPEDHDEYWYSLIEAANGFSKKYGTDFARMLAKGLIDELTRKHNPKDSK